MPGSIHVGLWLTAWHWVSSLIFPVTAIPPRLLACSCVIWEVNNRLGGGHCLDMVSRHQHEQLNLRVCANLHSHSSDLMSKKYQKYLSVQTRV
jgi:hypothetical protein